MRKLALAFALGLVGTFGSLGLASSADAQVVYTYYAPSTPVTTYYAPATVAAPVTTYYAPSVAAPVTTYYAPSSC